MLDREMSKLADQYSILDGHEEEVVQIVTKNFLGELDIAMRERGFSALGQLKFQSADAEEDER
jgi:hypothetical protein